MDLKRFPFRRHIAPLAASALTLVVLFPHSVSAACGSWSESPVAHLDTRFTEVLDVSASWSSNAWAVGEFHDRQGNEQALALRWDGDRWQSVIVPHPGRWGDQLWGVETLAADDAWSVGWLGNNFGTAQIIYHWDGVSWTQTAAPEPGPQDRLYGISASSSSNVWAVGFVYDGHGYQGLTEHYDGASWHVFSSPARVEKEHELYDVVTVNGATAWAVGDTSTRQGTKPLIERWDADSWQVAETPHVGTDFSFLTAVDASGPNDAWAAGAANNGHETLLEHWNGGEWTLVNLPRKVPEGSIEDISSLSRDRAWAIEQTNGQDALVLKWNGRRWRIAAKLGAAPFFVRSLDAIPSGHLWAAGTRGSQPAIKEFCPS